MKLKNRLIIAGIIILVYVVLRVAGAIKKPDPWYAFCPPEGGFCVRLPAAPEKSAAVPLPLGAQKTTLTLNQVSFLKSVYIVAYAPVTIQARGNLSDTDILRQNFAPLERGGYTKLNEDSIRVAGNPAVYSSWASPDKKFTMISRNILTPTHLYRLVISTPADAVAGEEEHIKHFFSSFAAKK